MTIRFRRALRVPTLLALTLLAACGGGDRPIPHARGIPQAFGDRAPHDWQGQRPDQLAVHGIDVSRYQGLIDWPRAARAGVAFAIVKATEGGDRVDPLLSSNLRAARWAGVPVGAYHFYYFCTPPEQQAAWFIANAGIGPGDLPPVLDIEWNHTSPTCHRRPDDATARAEAATFLDILTRHYGQRPIVYTTIDFWSDAQLWRLGAQDFWLRSVAGHPDGKFNGHAWTFWQYTGTGVVPGIPTDVDLNAFAGSPAEWSAWRSRRSLRTGG